MDPPLSGRCIGVVDLYAPVQTQYGKFDVQAQTDTGIEAQLPVETVEMENRSGRRRGMPAGNPDIAHIDERRSVSNAQSLALVSWVCLFQEEAEEK